MYCSHGEMSHHCNYFQNYLNIAKINIITENNTNICAFILGMILGIINADKIATDYAFALNSRVNVVCACIILDLGNENNSNVCTFIIRIILVIINADKLQQIMSLLFKQSCR